MNLTDRLAPYALTLQKSPSYVTRAILARRVQKGDLWLAEYDRKASRWLALNDA